MNFSVDVSMRFKNLIDNEVVLHNGELNVDFVVRSVSVTDDLITDSFEVRVEIDILDDTDKELLKQIDILQERVLGELLPTKRPEKFAGEEW